MSTLASAVFGAVLALGGQTEDCPHVEESDVSELARPAVAAPEDEEPEAERAVSARRSLASTSGAQVEGVPASPVASRRTLRVPRLEAFTIPPPSLMKGTHAPRRSSLIHEVGTLPCRLGRIGLGVPAHATIAAASDPLRGRPRLHSEVGVRGRTVVLGIFELYAQGGAAVQADVTPRVATGHELTVLPTSRLGLGARASEHVELAIELSRRGPMSLDPLGDEARGMASLRWQFGR